MKKPHPLLSLLFLIYWGCDDPKEENKPSVYMKVFVILFIYPDFNLIPHGFSISFPIIIIPPLGPLSVLCVVEVTT